MLILLVTALSATYAPDIPVCWFLLRAICQLRLALNERLVITMPISTGFCSRMTLRVGYDPVVFGQLTSAFAVSISLAASTVHRVVCWAQT